MLFIKLFKCLVIINPFATSDAYMRQLFHCLQWYTGSERVKVIIIHIQDEFIADTYLNCDGLLILLNSSLKIKPKHAFYNFSYKSQF